MSFLITLPTGTIRRTLYIIDKVNKPSQRCAQVKINALTYLCIYLCELMFKFSFLVKLKHKHTIQEIFVKNTNTQHKKKIKKNKKLNANKPIQPLIKS